MPVNPETINKPIESAEERLEVKAVRIIRRCKCGGVMFDTFCDVWYPFRYKHRCEKCGAEEWLTQKYPRIEISDGQDLRSLCAGC